MGRSEGLTHDGEISWHKWEVPRNMPICVLLGPLWQSCHAWITYRSICRVVIVTADQVTCQTISPVQLDKEWACITNIWMSKTCMTNI